MKFWNLFFVMLIGTGFSYGNHDNDINDPYAIPLSVSTNCVNEVLHFTPKLSSDNVISCFWDFGDASFSTDIKPFHAYENTGTYKVKLTVIYKNGNQVTHDYKLDVKPFPFAYFQHKVICDGPTNFFDNTKSEYPLKDWTWTNNKDTISNDKFFEESLTSGTHGVELFVSDVNGCSDKQSKQIKINPKPEIQFINKELCANTNTSIKISYGVDDEDIVEKQLLINNEPFEDEQLKSMRFSKTGKIAIKAFVKDKDGCTDLKSDSIDIQSNRISNIYVFEKEGCSPFNLKSEIKSNDKVSNVTWLLNEEEIGNGTSNESEIIIAGQYNLKGSVQLSNGCIHNTPTEIINIYPNQAISSVVKAEIRNNKAIGVIYSSDTSQIKTVDWGDGNIESYKLSAKHEYEDFGNYLVKNKALNEWGCEDSIIHHFQLNMDHKLNFTDIVSPNGDGRNDSFEIFNDLGNDYQLQIFDATGRSVFQTRSSSWNAIIGNSIAPSGIYLYKITSSQAEFPDYHGKFMIQR